MGSSASKPAAGASHRSSKKAASPAHQQHNGSGNTAALDAAANQLLQDLSQRLAAAETELRELRQRQAQHIPAAIVGAGAGGGANGALPALLPKRSTTDAGTLTEPAEPSKQQQQQQGSGGRPPLDRSPSERSLAAVPVPPAPPSAAPLPSTVPMEATRIVMHQIVAPAECDALGICTGGQVGAVLCTVGRCCSFSFQADMEPTQ